MVDPYCKQANIPDQPKPLGPSQNGSAYS